MNVYSIKHGQEEIMINLEKILFLSRRPDKNMITLINYVTFEISKEEMERLWTIMSLLS